MNRNKLNDYRESVIKQHESRLKELRKERLTEEQRLDGLKKILIMKMNMRPTPGGAAQAS